MIDSLVEVREKDVGKVIVNFGSGPSAPKGFTNIDGSPTVLFARLPLPARAFGSRAEQVRGFRNGQVKYGTARRIQYGERSLDGFYASHVLEHMGKADCMNLLARVRFWLKPTGILRIVLPDLRKLGNRYTEGHINADQFIENSGLVFDCLGFWRILFGHAGHRWMYDAESMTALLKSLGYRNIRRCECGETALEELAALDRCVNRAEESFYVEASGTETRC